MKRGFTLIELLVVIVIVAILAAITIPIVGGMRDRADVAACVSKLKALGAYANHWTGEHNGQFWKLKAVEVSPGDLQSWISDLKTGYPDAPNEVTQCPSYRKRYNPDWQSTGNSYSMHTDLDGDGNQANFRSPAIRMAQIPYPSLIPMLFDGTPNDESNARWAGGTENYFDATKVGDYHVKGGHNVMFVDGHIETSDREKIAQLEQALKDAREATE